MKRLCRDHFISIAVAGTLCGCAHGTANGAERNGATARVISPGPAVGRNPTGKWDGVVRSSGATPVTITITLDSVSGAWRGSFLAPVIGSQAIPFVSITHVHDSVALRLPAIVQNAVLHGHISADGNRMDGAIENSNGQTFNTARAGSVEAAALVAEVARVEASRHMVTAVTRASDSVVAPPHADPDSAKLITSDIPLFWEAVDSTSRTPDSLAVFLQRDYLDRATVGVRDFIPGRILSAEDLAMSVRDHRARYDSVRAANFEIARAEPAIRAAFRRLKALYPDAVFPDVYFVIGRFNSGGTASKHGLLIGAEMYSDPNRLPAIVSHELIHFQQHYLSPTLLGQSFREGSADFLGEMISGAQINNAAHQYGLAHEHELWKELKPHSDDTTTFFPWMYGKPPNGRPADLGYFIGYRIAQAYYNRMGDKAQAIRDIISADGGDVKTLLARSEYNP